MRSFIQILEILDRHAVEFAVVGGVAAVLHGAPVATFDLDALVRVSEDNARRLLHVFGELDARYREHAAVIRPQLREIMAGGHLLLGTNAGPFDVLGRIGRADRYEDLIDRIHRVNLDGLMVPVLGLEELIRQKQATGRDKDQAALRLLQEVARRRAAERTGGA